MEIQAPEKTRPLLRLLIAILLALQLTGPAAYVMAEPAPSGAPHSEHLGTEGSPGCHPFHDEALCGSCRFFDGPLALAEDRTAPAVAELSEAALRSPADRLQDGPAESPVLPRAPPCI